MIRNQYDYKNKSKRREVVRGEDIKDLKMLIHLDYEELDMLELCNNGTN